MNRLFGKTIRRSSALAAFLVLSGAVSAHAADWVRYTYDASGCTLLYDRESIETRFRGDTVRVTVKVDSVLNPDCRDAHVKRLRSAYYQADNYSHSLREVELDCYLDRGRVLSTTDYDIYGITIRSKEEDYPRWEMVPVLSEVGKLHREVCRSIKK